MKRLIYFAIVMILLLSCAQGQQNTQAETPTMDDFELSPENAHPNAQMLLTEEFYWSPIEETAPFGSDDASDSFYGFREWRQENMDESPVTYVNELIEEWGYRKFKLSETDPEKVRQILENVGSGMVIGQDNAIIAVGFGQFVLEGKVDRDMKALTKYAIKRELTPDLINEFRSDYRETRRGYLEKMLQALDKM